MRPNENTPRIFTDDELNEILFILIKNDISLSYKDVQSYLTRIGKIEEPRNSWSSNPTYFPISDYLVLLELFWDNVQRNILIPVVKDSYGNPNVPFHYAIPEKSKNYFNQDEPNEYLQTKSITYEKKESSESILIEKHKKQINNMIDFYKLIKLEVSNTSGINEQEIQFLSQEYFNKKWNPLNKGLNKGD